MQVPSGDALTVADALVQTSLWGIDSHGIARVPHYLARLRAGSIEAQPLVRVQATGPCTARLTGGHGLGIVVCNRAMAAAIEFAHNAGVGAVGVSESSHCGAIGLYTRMAANEGLIGIALTHSDALVVPFEGKEKFLGTNPISFAFPRRDAQPLCLDMASSALAWNRVLNARRIGDTLAEGAAVDKDGIPTRDPHAAAALSPLGGETWGYKGYGLALVIDLLCGPLNGMPSGPHISAMYGNLRERRNLGSFMMAIDPRRFAVGTQLAEIVALVSEELALLAGNVLSPGDPEYLCERRRSQEGIPVDVELLSEMDRWSSVLSIARVERGPTPTL